MNKTKIKQAFVCGFPIAHSKSPIIHNYWLKQNNIAGSYEKIAVESENFNAFIIELQQNGFTGGNVTLPHKEAAFQQVQKLDEVAQKIGAVNTLWYENDILYGGNTDAYGFTANLDQYCEDWSKNADQKTAMVIGAGGACRAILYALLERGFSKIILANRTLKTAQKLADEFSDKILPINLEETSSHISSVDFLVNTTSLGMYEDDALPVDIKNIKSTAVVTDIVYTPLKTKLLKQAEAMNLKTIDGLGMLLHQAVPGFEKWFGVRPQVNQELRNLVLAELK
ncbi:MAG: shikimate dehydrogenase [Nitratireductor sp.]